MRKIVAIGLVFALASASVPLVGFAAGARQDGRISGVARDASQNPLPNVTARLRNVDTGQLVAETRTSASGEYEFTGLDEANYVVEIVDDDGNIVGTSTTIALAAGAAATGVAIAASAAAVGAALERRTRQQARERLGGTM